MEHKTLGERTFEDFIIKDPGRFYREHCNTKFGEATKNFNRGGGDMGKCRQEMTIQTTKKRVIIE